MNDTRSIRTKSLSSKSALPPFQIRGLEQILFHAGARLQAIRPNSSHALLLSRSQSSHLRPQTSYNRKAFPLAIEAGSASNTDCIVHETSNSNEKAARRRSSINDRNVQVLRAINDVLTAQLDSLEQELETTSNTLRERQLDLSYVTETQLSAADEISELRQQLREREETIRQKDELLTQKDELLTQKEEVIRQKDELVIQKEELLTQKEEVIRQQDETIHQKEEEIILKDQVIHAKDVAILEQTKALIKGDQELSDEHNDLYSKDQDQNLQSEQLKFSSERTSTSRFLEEDCPVFPDHTKSPPSELDLNLMTEKRPLSKQPSAAKSRFAIKEIFREQREVRSRKAAIKANIRAGKVEDRKREREVESTRVSGAFSRGSSDGNIEPVDGGRTKSFTLKSLVGGRHPRVYPKSRDFSLSGSEGGRSSREVMA